VFTETTNTSWFSRIGNSIKGLLFGGIFILLSIGFLWWNEGRSVKTAKGLDDGDQVTVEAEAGTIDPAMQGKLVHVTGKTAVKTSASDAEFGLTTSDVIKLKRRVEVFQWVEDKSESSSRKTGDASVLARQVTDTFEAYATPYGTSIARIASGIQSKQAMFAAARAENKVVTWLLRAGGLLLMFFGLLALFQPLKILADILPLAGSIVGAGTGLVALLLAAMGSFIVVALAWLWYRPVIGFSLLLLAGACLFLLFRALHRKTA
jgi:hypothetical protein